MTGLTTLGLHHISLVTADARRAAQFYGDALGLWQVAGEVDQYGPGSTPLWFSSTDGAPGTLLNVVEMPGAPRGRYGVGGTHHFALGTATYQTLLMWKRRLVDLGIPVTGPMPRGYFTSLYFRDPDGQVVEIATAGPGYTLDEPIGELGRGVMVQDASQLPGGRDEARIAATTHPVPVPTITPEMAIDGIHHISAMTDDIGRAHEFYEAALGLRLIKKTVNQDDPDTPHWFWANYDGTRVLPASSWTLFGWTPRHPKARAGTGQAAHVAFRAKDAEEQLAWRDHLLGMGLEVSPVEKHAHHSSIALRAPDGQPLVIATDGPGFNRTPDDSSTNTAASHTQGAAR
jgi:glyoxalase family protein